MHYTKIIYYIIQLIHYHSFHISPPAGTSGVDWFAVNAFTQYIIDMIKRPKTAISFKRAPTIRPFGPELEYPIL